LYDARLIGWGNSLKAVDLIAIYDDLKRELLQKDRV
jgi:hypothetical protein